MDMRRLEAFRMVYELGSFSRAGERLHLSQPTISAHIASLEEELGTRLFDRLGRTISPTQAGTILHAHAAEAFQSLEAARAEIAALTGEVSGELSVGASTIPATYILPAPLAGFVRAHPGVRLHMENGDSSHVARMVEDGRLDCGVVGAEPAERDLLSDLLLEDETVVVAAHDFPCGEEIDPADMADLPWVMRERGSATRSALEALLASRGLDHSKLTATATVGTTQAMLRLVSEGLGVSTTSRAVVERDGPSLGVRAVYLRGFREPRRFWFIRHAKRHALPVTLAFQEYLQTRMSAP
ncbi:LysR family transcriptional regulator [Desulfohalovibrio reitneri]|uniref:LysR family transcriptional regulator n=1 Tax=Desulfohalovibrio reitneri TaxID=1307759 RepID=UPI0004A720AF|nr:LysR family transcriptional regulator [Desulfohalovibrio reitneri]